MKVKMITRMAGPNGSYAPGDETEFDATTAQALVEGGYAKPLKEAGSPEAEGEASSTSETDGDKDEPESDNAAGDGTVKSGRGKKKSEN